MQLGKEIREIECAPLEWPKDLPQESAPEQETVPAEEPSVPGKG
jgi:hypothetical protein